MKTVTGTELITPKYAKKLKKDLARYKKERVELKELLDNLNEKVSVNTTELLDMAKHDYVKTQEMINEIESADQNISSICRKLFYREQKIDAITDLLYND